MKLLFTLLFLLACNVVAAQNARLHGTVLNEKKQPIANASITLWDNFITARHCNTDSNGYYSFSSESQSRYRMQISHPGYSTYNLRWVEVSEKGEQELNA